jgi:hypothetical protein
MNTMKRVIFLRGAAALVMLATLLAFSNGANAQATGTITIHSRLCPAGQPTTDIFTDCHGHLPTIATSYSLDGGAAQAVGGDGNTSFTGVAAGAHTIAQVDGVPLDFAHLRAFCSDQENGGAAAEVSVNVNSFSVTAVDGHEIICDVYTIPENASGLTPTATAAPAAPTATTVSGGTASTLPGTGVGPSSGGNDTALELGLLALAFAGLGLVVLRRHDSRQS